MIAIATTGHIGAGNLRAFFEVFAKSYDIVGRIIAASVATDFRIGAFGIETKLAQIGIFDAKQVSDFTTGEFAQLFGRVRRKKLGTVCLQPL